MGVPSFLAIVVVLLSRMALVGAFLFPPTALVQHGSSHQHRCLSRTILNGLSASNDGTTTGVGSTEEAKSNLLRLLVENGGTTLNEDVKAAIEVLVKLNPTPNPARAWSILTGDWNMIGADFVGTERTKNGIEATLGRLSFNIFEPTEVPVLLTSVTTFMRLPSAQAAAESPDADDANYGIASNFVTRDGSELRGRVVLLARCTEDSSEADRMQIQFLRTKLEPDESQDLDAWRAVIGRKAEDSEGADMLDGGVLSHEWTKSPLGTLDVLYVDEDVRITRGNMGALVVVTRM